MDDQTKRLIEKAVAILKAAGAADVYAFGSAVRGTLRAGSDIDLAVTGLPPRVFYRAMAEAADAMGRTLDLVDLDEATPFTRYLTREGELQRVG